MGDYKYITAKNIKASGFDFSNITYVPEAVHRPIFERCNPEQGDVLYIKDGATTGIAIVNESNNYVMNADGTGDYSISKSAFVNAICEEKDSFKGFSFDEFQKIFDVINSIVSSSKE